MFVYFSYSLLSRLTSILFRANIILYIKIPFLAIPKKTSLIKVDSDTYIMASRFTADTENRVLNLGSSF